MGYKPPDAEMSAILTQALSNLRVQKAASKLMIYYAAQSTGFRPSLSRIDEKIHVGIKNISTHRKRLIDKGLIEYTGDDIIIDWVRLSAIASMDKQLMGHPSRWRIAPACRKQEKIEVHNNKERGFSSKDIHLMNVYEATAQAIQDGVAFPELSKIEVHNIYGTTISQEVTAQNNGEEDTLDEKIEVHNNIGSTISQESETLKIEVHNIYGSETSVGWYNPFDEPDPAWVYQVPLLDAYGEPVGWLHYDVVLPF